MPRKRFRAEQIVSKVLSLPHIESDSPMGRYWAMFCGMVNSLRLIWGTLADFFRSRVDLQTEVIASRHQLNFLRR